MSTRTWNLATVIDNADPDKRKRLRLRFPKQGTDDIPDDKLLWTLPAQTMPSASFDLPDIGDTVLVLTNNDYVRWLYLPDKSQWSDLSTDDYTTALVRKHKDVLSIMYTKSNGWQLNMSGKSIDLVYDNVHITTDGTALTATIKDIKVDTDGSKLSVSNNSVDLKQLIDSLLDALQKHNHTTPTGASGVPINLQDFIQNKTDFDKLLK